MIPSHSDVLNKTLFMFVWYVCLICLSVWHVCLILTDHQTINCRANLLVFFFLLIFQTTMSYILSVQTANLVAPNIKCSKITLKIKDRCVGLVNRTSMFVEEGGGGDNNFSCYLFGVYTVLTLQSELDVNNYSGHQARQPPQLIWLSNQKFGSLGWL